MRFFPGSGSFFSPGHDLLLRLLRSKSLLSFSRLRDGCLARVLLLLHGGDGRLFLVSSICVSDPLSIALGESSSRREKSATGPYSSTVSLGSGEAMAVAHFTSEGGRCVRF